MGLFLATLETTIVATSLSTLAAKFNDSTRVSWVVTAYLLTYSGKVLPGVGNFCVLTVLR